MSKQSSTFNRIYSAELVTDSASIRVTILTDKERSDLALSQWTKALARKVKFVELQEVD